MNRKIAIAGLLFVLAAAVVVLGIPRGNESARQASGGKLEFTEYKSPTCGCCGIYADYMKHDFNVKVVDTGDLNAVNSAEGVPKSLESCHTGKIGRYFVVGHIPEEAIKKLIEEQPDIKGIAMPGMPSGSPGMPGPKNGPFVIYQVNNDGSYSEFMRI